MAVDPGDDTDLADPQSWNKYAYVRNNPLAFVDLAGEEITYASDAQKIMLDQARAKSASLNSALAGFEGAGAPNLTFKYGDAGKDANNIDNAEGVTNAPISPGQYDDAAIAGEPTTEANTDPAKTNLQGGATITIDDSVKGTGGEKDATIHEIGHANDARTNSKQYLYDSKRTKDSNGATPHDQRPEEGRANKFKDKVNSEIKGSEKKK
jgi:hypothetical protein